jgi:hypothetical protein
VNSFCFEKSVERLLLLQEFGYAQQVIDEKFQVRATIDRTLRIDFREAIHRGCRSYTSDPSLTNLNPIGSESPRAWTC